MVGLRGFVSTIAMGRVVSDCGPSRHNQDFGDESLGAIRCFAGAIAGLEQAG
ncbi:MAG: hypothetical protein WCR23_00785 [Planctomycetota bacterium]|nr:hypothetical protein [Planctomycetia bacterium]MDO7677777.1 hypothetical protein [Pirellulales bacterium]